MIITLYSTTNKSCEGWVLGWKMRWFLEDLRDFRGISRGLSPGG